MIEVFTFIHTYGKIEEMKKIEFTRPLFENNSLRVRNNRDDLIRQIVEATTEENKKALAKRIALVANQLKWSDMDLHALLKKKGQVRNFTAFVKWSIKIQKK